MAAVRFLKHDCKTENTMSDFATTYAAALRADPDLSRRGARVLSILDSPDSSQRTRMVARWQAATIDHYRENGMVSINWDTFWTVLERIATVLSIIIMILPFLAVPPGTEYEVWGIESGETVKVMLMKFINPNTAKQDADDAKTLLESQGATEIEIRPVVAKGATMTPTPAEIQELTDKLTALVNGPPYNGDYNAVFAHYAGPDNLVDKNGLTILLTDAGIGNRFTRSFWESGIMAQLDTDHDGKLSLDEIKTAMPQQT
jgi:hypothetical protein